MLNVQRIAWPLIVVLALSVGAVWCVATAQEAKKPVEQWEYYVTTNVPTGTPDALGAKGWELVTVIYKENSSQLDCYYKRRK